jgi:gamma-butyrobetaine dioxygenase
MTGGRRPVASEPVSFSEPPQDNKIMTTVTLQADQRLVTLDAGNGPAHFPLIWLRDNAPEGFHPQTHERLFDLTSVPLDLSAQDARIEGATLVIDWDGDTSSRFDLSALMKVRPGSRRADPAHIAPVTWRGDLGAAGIPRASADAVTTDDAALQSWLVDTQRYGLSIIEGLADSTGAGMDVARRIGFLRETNFGVTFEVISKPNPNNLAYTPVALPLHTDLTNQELPPGFQFLHCLANEATGGGSLFCDGYAIAEDLRRDAPEVFALLSEISIPFRFHDDSCDIRGRKHVITLNEDGEVTEFCFNAHLADILDLEPEVMVAYYAAYRRIMEMTRDPKYLVTLKLKAGEMVVFDNRRALHGRQSFDPSTGRRHLHGCYVDRGEFDSRLRLLAR